MLLSPMIIRKSSWKPRPFMPLIPSWNWPSVICMRSLTIKTSLIIIIPICQMVINWAIYMLTAIMKPMSAIWWCHTDS